MTKIKRPSLDPIVISGVSGRFAGIPNPRALWKNILHKSSQFTPFATSEDVYSSIQGHGAFPGANLPEHGAFLKNLYGCAVDQVPLPPDLSIGDNADVYFISQLIYEALQDTGINPSNPPTDRISLFLGYESPFNSATVNWLQHAAGVEQTMSILQRFFPAASSEQIRLVRNELFETLPPLKERQISLAQPSGLITQLAHQFGISDTATICNTGDASIFTALELAIDALQSNRCDLAIVGAVQPPLSETYLIGISGIIQFTRDAQIRPFTDESAGTLPGEGGAFFILQRLSDAEERNEIPYAKVHGTGIVCATPNFSDETERNQEILRRAMHRALRYLPNRFRDIDYWEMNGSGIPAEDSTEESLLERMTSTRGAHIPLLALGAIKPSIGHTLTASGAASLLKATLAVSHKILPPSVTPESNNFHLRQRDMNYYWVQEARPWIASSTRKRRIMVSTFAECGRAGCAVLEGFEENR